jgi:hypothetical protein
VYHLAELDGMVSKLCYMAFQLIAYHACSPSFIPVTCVIDRDDLASVTADDLPMQEEQQAVMMTGDSHI